MGVERRRQGSLHPSWVVGKACPEERMVAVTVTAARVATRAVVVLEAGAAVRKAVVMVEATGVTVGTRVVGRDGAKAAEGTVAGMVEEARAAAREVAAMVAALRVVAVREAVAMVVAGMPAAAATVAVEVATASFEARNTVHDCMCLLHRAVLRQTLDDLHPSGRLASCGSDLGMCCARTRSRKGMHSRPGRLSRCRPLPLPS